MTTKETDGKKSLIKIEHLPWLVMATMFIIFSISLVFNGDYINPDIKKMYYITIAIGTIFAVFLFGRKTK